ncbi:Nucleolar protein 4 [Bagarius yarrelli]|uniref:Nucleolar protein 4 n=1 Tax=Bagarius yarrelli TaxID=175774 RepID=A0A556U2J9_BAGYA|nr:Nucleolar protein 4 [Bagarius yarrelli]
MSGRKHNADFLIRSSEQSESEMFGEFQDWCLRTYGDSAKTKTVTRRKYDKILQALSLTEDTDAYTDGNHINAKFKFWVKSKGFQVGNGDHQKTRNGKSDRPVLYVPIKATSVDGASGQDISSLKRVAVVEDFYNIIYAMHVDISSDPAKVPKHAGQKKTYKAIAETYAFLPREAVTRFLMGCGECQKRMHISPSGAECKENDRPASLAPDLIDYNMPLTTTYLKQMKLQCINNNEQCRSDIVTEAEVTEADLLSLAEVSSSSQGELTHLFIDLDKAISAGCIIVDFAPSEGTFGQWFSNVILVHFSSCDVHSSDTAPLCLTDEQASPFRAAIKLTLHRTIMRPVTENNSFPSFLLQ